MKNRYLIILDNFFFFFILSVLVDLKNNITIGNNHRIKIGHITGDPSGDDSEWL